MKALVSLGAMLLVSAWLAGPVLALDFDTESVVTPTSGATGSDSFGSSVGLDGDRMIVGSPNTKHVEGGTTVLYAGAAFIFEKTAGVWVQKCKVEAEVPMQTGYFGTSVAISGDYAVVGSPKETVDGRGYTGRVYVYKRDQNGDWVSDGILPPPDALEWSGSRFGTSVAIRGTTIVAGGPQYDVPDYPNAIADGGQVCVFTRDESSWEVTGQFGAALAGSGARLGASVAISPDGSRIIVGAPGADSSIGAAYVFSSGGTQLAILTPSTTQAALFGTSVDIDGDHAVVGAPNHRVRTDNDQAGAAYIFSEADEWASPGVELTIEDTPNSYSTNLHFGASVGVRGSRVLVGCPYATTGDSDGRAYCFDQTDGNWAPASQVLKLDGDAPPNPRYFYFGCSLSFDGNDVAIGAKSGNSTGGVIVKGTAPALVSAVSRKTHGTAGDFDIPLPLDGAAVECRSEGETWRLVFTFDEPIRAASGGVQVTLTPSGGTVGQVEINGSELIVPLSGVADETCLTVAVGGIEDLLGEALAGDDDVQISCLIGDVNGSGLVDQDDSDIVASYSGGSASSGTCRFDVNGDGSINATDVALAASKVDNSVTCP